MHYLRWRKVTPAAERPPRPRLGLTPLDRFYSFVSKDGPVAKNRPDLGRCHLWTGGTDPKGYGIFWADGTSHRAHIWIYKLKVGPVPPGKDLDHFACDTPGCVNELHTRPAPPRENVLRSSGPASLNAAKDRCDEGHVYTEETARVNAQGARECLICKRKAQQQLRQAQRALERGYVPLRPGSITCPVGHDLTAKDASRVYHGHLVCLVCTAPTGKGGRRKGVSPGRRLSAFPAG